MRHIISIDDFSKAEMESVLSNASEMHGYLQKGKVPELMKGKILATLFFEPSTRTRLSFEAAMLRLGGSVTGFSDAKATSVKKKETVADTIMTVAAYTDVIAMRHHLPGSARLASEVSSVPVINGGDGANQHPTQTLLDLFTIRQELDSLEGLSVAFVGDLKYGRTVHSLCSALEQFNASFTFIAPDGLAMPDIYKKGNYREATELDVADADVVYMTRIQQERFPNPTEYEKLKGAYVMTPKVMETMKKKSIVMHPLPRVEEISWKCDSDPRSVYFKQAYYGVPTRMALLAMATGVIE